MNACPIPPTESREPRSHRSPQPQLLHDGPSPSWDGDRGWWDRSRVLMGSVSASEVVAHGWGQAGRDPRPLP